MTEIKPFIKCTDIWKDHIPPDKLAAYKQLIDEGQILKHHVLYSRRTGVTVVEYSSTVPHEWIREELRKRCEKLGQN